MRSLLVVIFILFCTAGFAQIDLPDEIPDLTISPDGGRIDLSAIPILGQLGLGDLYVDIPAGAVSEEVNIQINIPTEIPEDKSALQAVEFNVEGYLGQFDFSNPVTIGIPYPENVADETLLTIKEWDTESADWKPIDLIETISANIEANVISAQVNHFSVYGVVELEDEEVVVASLAVSPEEAEVFVGGEIMFSATVFDAEGNNIEADITWSVDGEMGEISADGEFTALLAGSGTVIAAAGEVTAQAAVTVNEVPAEETDDELIEIFPNKASVVIGETAQFEVMVKDAGGNEIEDPEVVWEVSNSEVGTIDENGLFTAATEGETEVIATSGELSGEAEVTVTDEEQPPAPDANIINIRRQLRNGNIVKFGSKNYEGGRVTIGGLPSPYNYLNGSKIFFPENSLSEDITITIKIPEFAKIKGKDVEFDGDILTAITFEVTVDGEVVSPFVFDEPVEVTIPFKKGLLNNLGIDPEDLGLFFVDESGGLDVSGIEDIEAGELDENSGEVTGDVAHFSDIAIAPKSAGPVYVEDDTRPEGFALSQNYPNPFNPETTIPYRISEASMVTITIYNVVGQHVRTLVDEIKPAGSYSVTWNGTNDAGIRINNGLYFYRIEAGNFTQTRKLIMMK